MASSLDKLAAAPTSSKALTLVLLLGLVGAAWYGLYYSDLLDDLQKAETATPSLMKKVKKEQAALKELSKYQGLINQLKQERNHMRDRLPEKPDISKLLEQIHNQAKIVGLAVERFERNESTKEELYAKIPVKMQLTGTFHQIATFFFYLGRLTRLVNVQDIELKTLGRKVGKNGNLDNRIVANCAATTFMYLANKNTSQAKGQAK
jgi:type IV pilus assembly protein PilO